MAPWALLKLLHPFTADDILASQKIVSSLHLPPSTSQFVLALADPRSPGNVVYILGVEKLSERSIGDIHSLVTAVNPKSVVAFVDVQYVTDILDEEALLDAPESLDVPTSVIQVIKSCFLNKTKANVYESRAGLRVLINVFGTTFYGNVFAAKKAAAKAGANFEYFRFPSTASTAFPGEEVGEEGSLDGSALKIAPSKLSFAVNFLSGLSLLLGGNNLEYFSGASNSLGTASRSRIYSQELRAPSQFVASNLVSGVANLSVSSANSRVSADYSDSTPLNQGLPLEFEYNCPSFAVPFYPLFVDLHSLFKETPGVNQALNFARNLVYSVEKGDEVDQEDLSRARLFRVAVESVRLSWNSFVQSQRKTSYKATDFSQLPFEEKCQALLAQALQHQAQKLGTVVAVVDASSVPGIRKHWNTTLPPEVAAYKEYCFVSLDSEEVGDGSKTAKGSKLLENPETKAAVVVSAGAAAAGLVYLPHWASASFMKVFSFKVPTVLKIFWLQMKRQTVVSWAKAATPVSKAVMPTIKAVSSGKIALAPSSTTKALLLKSSATAEKARATAHSMVAAAERASFQALRTAFYSLMRNRQAKIVGPGPWLLFGGSVVAAATVFCYGEEVEHVISIAPSAGAVVRLGQGLENLDRASQALSEREGSGWWDHIYDTLYRRHHKF